MNLQRTYLLGNIILKNQIRHHENLLSKYRSSYKMAEKKFYSPASDSKRQLFIEPKSVIKEESFLTKVANKLPFVNVNKGKLDIARYILYESIVDNIDYMHFFTKLELPDTFYSWFTITELHMWMLMVRCMSEEKEGKHLRNGLVQVMWIDINQRVKKVGDINPSGMKAQLLELSEQFQAALIAYDEGLQVDDTVLAAALWRRMYQQRDVKPENLECLVKYIRKHIRKLDNIPKEELFLQKLVLWEPLSN